MRALHEPGYTHTIRILTFSLEILKREFLSLSLIQRKTHTDKNTKLFEWIDADAHTSVFTHYRKPIRINSIPFRRKKKGRWTEGEQICLITHQVWRECQMTHFFEKSREKDVPWLKKSIRKISWTPNISWI